MSITALQWSKVMETHSGYDLKLGPTNVDRLIRDPKCFGFFLSRYKFAGKMLRDCGSIIDVGCGDGIGTLGLLGETRAIVLGVDFDRSNIDYADRVLVPAVGVLRQGDVTRLTFRCGDFLTLEEIGWFDGLVCLDVIEHIDPDDGTAFIENMAATLTDGGVAVVGTPSLASAPFASEHSKVGHINLYDPDRFRSSLKRSFRQVFMFSMNDEVVHTGFDRLAHYLIAVAVK